MSEELKPCPLCGGAAECAYNVSQDNYSMAECQSCGARAFWKKWNTRAETPQSIPSEREEIVKWLRGPHPDKYPFARAWEFAAFGNHFADSIERGDYRSTRQALEQGSAKGSRATASRQPAGGPSDPSQQVVSAKGAHQAQGGE